MSDHDHTHQERLSQVAFGGASATGEILRALAGCDDCLTQLARSYEASILLGPPDGTRAVRLGTILEEALVWRAVLDDVGGAESQAPGVEIAKPEKQKGE